MQNRSRYTALTNAAGLLAPTFALAAASLTSITVTITPAVGTTATSYRIRYSSANGNFTDPLDYTTIERTGTFTLTGLAAGATYYFSVAAVNSIANTAFSAAQSIAAAPVFSAIDNADGRLSASWTENNLVDAVNDTQTIEKSANGTTGWTTAGTVAYNATSGFATINNPSLSQYYRLKVYRHSGAQTFYSNVVGPRTVTGDTDAAAYITRMISAGKTPSSGENTILAALAKAVRDAGLTSADIDFWLTGWGVAAANRLKFYSGSCTETGGTNTHAAGGLTFGSGGYFATGFIPGTTGWYGYGVYIKGTISPVAAMDIGCNNGASPSNLMNVNYTSVGYLLDYSNNSTARLTGTGQTLEGLYSMQKLSATTGQRLQRTTSSGTTTITNSNTGSGNLKASVQAYFGAANENGTAGTSTQRTYCAGFYVKTLITSTQWDAFNTALMTAISGLTWKT